MTRDRGTAGETLNPILDNWCDYRGGRAERKTEENKKKETGNRSPTQLLWTIQSPPTMRWPYSFYPSQPSCVCVCVYFMIHAGRKSWPYGVGCRVRESHPVSSSYELRAHQLALDGAGGVADSPPCINRRNYVNRFGTWNVKGINGTAKWKEVVDIFKQERFQLLALTERNWKGMGRYHGVK